MEAAAKDLPGTADSGEGRREGCRVLAAGPVEGCLRQVLSVGIDAGVGRGPGWRSEGE